jgi:hypothetical protein
VLSLADGVDEKQLARLEWRYLPIVGQYDRRPKVLEGLLARDAAFFVEVVEYVYRGEQDEEREVSEEARQRASRAFTLLYHWRTLPGSVDAVRGTDGESDSNASSPERVDAKELRAWVSAARSALAASGRGKIGDQLIGQVLSASPYDSDGSWPTRAVRDLIEDLGSTQLERGFSMGLYNRRGVTTRDPAAGGTLERGLAERYDGLAAAIADQWPRTGRLLREIADGYRRDAMREDHDAELGEDLGL